MALSWVGRGRGDKNDNHRHFNNMQRHSRLPRRASAATMALYNDKDTPGRLGAFRSTKGAALGSSYRTGTCFVRRGQMSPIMFSRACGCKSQNNSRTENTVVPNTEPNNRPTEAIAYGVTFTLEPLALDPRVAFESQDDLIDRINTHASSVSRWKLIEPRQVSVYSSGTDPLYFLFPDLACD